jgi:hypothetical protein
MQRIIALVLLGAALAAQAKPLPLKLVQDFARSHSSNGSAVGVVQWTGQGTGKEVKLGECSLAGLAQIAHLRSIVSTMQQQSALGTFTWILCDVAERIPRHQVPPPHIGSINHAVHSSYYYDRPVQVLAVAIG